MRVDRWLGNSAPSKVCRPSVSPPPLTDVLKAVIGSFSLVLQLLSITFSVVGLRGDVLMTAPPAGPAENEGEIESGLEKDSCEQIADFRHGRHEISQ